MPRDIEQLSLEKLPKSTEILERAKKVLLSPTVTGPFRAPKAVAFVKEAKGGKIVDHDGNEYIDVTMAYGPMILGHSHPVAIEAAKKAFDNGTALAITCGAGVFVWSQSFGLALVIGIAMVTAMVMAGISGALVPIILLRLGQDPATASSIILTTVTDVSGFLAFLGTATLLSSLL